MDGLPCMHCKQPVKPDEGKFFGGANNGPSVFVCPRCFAIAQRLFERIQAELHQLLVMAKEAVRVGLIEGRLQAEPDPREVPKTELLQTIVRLEEARAAAARQK